MVYESFFDKNDITLPYKSEAEYVRDLFAHLDMGLAYLCAYRTAEPTAGAGRYKLYMSQDEALRELIGADDGTGVNTALAAEARSLMQNELSAASGHIISRLASTEKNGASFIIKQIFDGFSLTRAERYMLLMALATSRRALYESTYEYLQGAGRTKPTLRLALSWLELSGEPGGAEGARLVALRGNFFEQLAITENAEADNIMACQFYLPRRIIGLLAGVNEPQPEHKTLYSRLLPGDEMPAMLIRHDTSDALRELIAERGSHHRTRDGCDVLNIFGEDGNGKLLPLRHAAMENGYGLLLVNVNAMAGAGSRELELLLRELKLECFLSRLLLCLVESEFDAEENEEQHTPFPTVVDYLLRRISSELDFCVWITQEKAAYLTQYPVHFMATEVPMLTAGEREVIWNEFTQKYVLEDKIDLTLCANQYILTVKGIKETLATADMLRISTAGDVITRENITDAMRQQASKQLGGYATRINAVFTWDDLVVEDEQKWEMKLICNQMRYRGVVGEKWGFHSKTPYGRGVCAMFYGAPGTGKTMAVQVMANELGLDLYRIDLSQMVSKYIGETEKNISRLFKRARNINALLFFDEADSMFAKRSDVKDSLDRNANAETAHLLQKLEDYSGITILATNFANNIDDAFKRRIKFMVNFAFPPPEVRLRLWKTILPPEALLDEELDIGFFAETFELSGSSIKEILTGAAYMAAAEQRGLRNEDVVRAIKLNFGKYGKVLTPEDFGYFGQVIKK